MVKIRSSIELISLSYPKKVCCNICRWEGRHFVSDAWHKHINCPKCRSGIRQRLFFATLQNNDELSFNTILKKKKILHFAPEALVGSNIKDQAAHYTTADLLRQDCDVQLDISDMPEIKNESYDAVIAFDVLEHVPNYQKALQEAHRVLSPNGFAIFTVPQKDNLDITYEDTGIVTPEEREKHFGQWDHLRIFGNDFTNTIENNNFKVKIVNESMFSQEICAKNVLFPPILSENSLATNYRKVFFCQKIV